MRHFGRQGFSLIELLVVIGIIVLLATIVLPMITQAHKQAIRVSMAADLQVIGQALEAYKHDFGDYPRPDRYQALDNPKLPFVTGAALLCWALVAPGPAVTQSNPNTAGGTVNPGDGADGPGFRVRGTVGAVKGPYLPSDRFLIGTADGMGVVHQPNVLNAGQTANFNNAEDVLADRNSSPILYLPPPPAPSPRPAPMVLSWTPSARLSPVSHTPLRPSSSLTTTRFT
jgi:prepilin-type N-terminal cleavage/methylation domain-containing protein